MFLANTITYLYDVWVLVWLLKVVVFEVAVMKTIAEESMKLLTQEKGAETGIDLNGYLFAASR